MRMRLPLNSSPYGLSQILNMGHVLKISTLWLWSNSEHKAHLHLFTTTVRFGFYWKKIYLHRTQIDMWPNFHATYHKEQSHLTQGFATNENWPLTIGFKSFKNWMTSKSWYKLFARIWSRTPNFATKTFRTKSQWRNAMRVDTWCWHTWQAPCGRTWRNRSGCCAARRGVW